MPNDSHQNPKAPNGSTVEEGADPGWGTGARILSYSLTVDIVFPISVSNLSFIPSLFFYLTPPLSIYLVSFRLSPSLSKYSEIK